MARLFLILLIPIYFLQAAVIIDKEPIDLELNELQIYIDDNLSNSFVTDKKFESLSLPRSIGAHKDKNVWIKIELINKLGKDMDLNLRKKYAHLSALVIYELQQGVLVQKSYYDRKDKKHNFKTLSLAHPFTLKKDEHKTFYFKMNSPMPMFMQFFIQNDDTSLMHYKKEVTYLSLYFGALFALLIYHLLLFFAIKTQLSLFYSVILSVTMLYLLSMTNYSVLIFGCAPSFGTTMYLQLVMMVFLIYFQRHVLNTRKYLPSLDLQLGFVVKLLFLLLFYFLIADITNYPTFTNGVMIYAALMLFLVSFYAVKKDLVLSRLFLMATFSHFLGLIFDALLSLELLTLNNFTAYMIYAGILIEIALFAFLLAYRIEAIQDKAHYIDQLTGIENLFKCKEVIEESADNYLLLLDIAEFNNMNKTYGKENANKILQDIAVHLQKNLNNAMGLYRAESDRFIIYIQNTSRIKVEEFCRTLISYFELNNLNVGEDEITIEFSVGIAAIEDIDSVFMNLEFALSHAKNEGRKQFSFFESTERDEEEALQLERIRITKKLVNEKLIIPYFQPIKDLKSGEITKYELLARGLYEGEIVPPAVFLGAAKRLGLLTTITTIMIKKGFPYFADNDFQFSINLTEQDLRNESFINYLLMRLKTHEIDPKRVTFEILETVKLENEPVIAATIKDLKSMGCKIAIDDFGVKESNLLRLLELDADLLKLDGQFIRDIEKSEEKVKIVKAIVSLSKTMGIQTVAEFVETKESHDILVEAGVDFAQGYYIARPDSELLIN